MLNTFIIKITGIKQINFPFYLQLKLAKNRQRLFESKKEVTNEQKLIYTHS